jgi:hypothetical protein
VGAILVKGPNHRTHFWKRTIQWLFHQNLVLNQNLVERSLGGPLAKWCPVIPTSNQDGRQSKNIKKGDEIKKTYSLLKLLSQSQPNFAEIILGWSPSKIAHILLTSTWISVCSPEMVIVNCKLTFFEENHSMTISSKFCSYWANGFRQEDICGNFP